MASRDVSTTEQNIVDIYTDGACSGSPGPGGWGAVLRYQGVEKELQGGEAETTNNRMEMLAAIHALEAMKRPVRAVIHTGPVFFSEPSGMERNFRIEKTYPSRPMRFW